MSAPEVHRVDGADLAPIVAVMDELADAGVGWVNLWPADAEAPPHQSVWGNISGRGPAVPRITWTAPQVGRRRARPAQLGIEHAAGGKVLARLDELEHPLPAGWLRIQDHAMRGLVLVPAVADETVDVLTWALRAVELMTGIPAAGPWQARVFRSR